MCLRLFCAPVLELFATQLEHTTFALLSISTFRLDCLVHAASSLRFVWTVWCTRPQVYVSFGLFGARGLRFTFRLDCLVHAASGLRFVWTVWCTRPQVYVSFGLFGARGLRFTFRLDCLVHAASGLRFVWAVWCTWPQVSYLPCQSSVPVYSYV